MILLRKLTEKSILDFNWVKGNTVRDLMDKKPYEILKIYYTFEKISFIDTILDELLKIFPNFYKIEKPGIDKDWKVNIFETKKYDEMNYQELKKLVVWYKIKGFNAPENLMLNYAKSKLCHMMKKHDTTENIHTKSSLKFMNRKFK